MTIAARLLPLALILASCAQRTASPSLKAASDNGSDYLTSTDGLPAGVTGSITGARQVSLAYQYFLNAQSRGAVIIHSGFGESYLSYSELIAEFYSQGYSVFIMDNRGMGLSGRELSNRQIVHVDSISDYVADSLQFVREVVEPLTSGPLLMFAHSTGGLIGAKVLAAQPKLYAAAVLSSPLMKMRTAIPYDQAYPYIGQQVAQGNGATYVIGQKDYDPADDTFAKSLAGGYPVTHSERRFNVGRDIRLTHPQVRSGGPSYQFDWAIMQETLAIDDFAPLIKTPVLLLQAELDGYVLPEGQTLLCSKAADCTLSVVAGAYHETFRETDEIRKSVLARVFAAFDKVK